MKQTVLRLPLKALKAYFGMGQRAIGTFAGVVSLEFNEGGELEINVEPAERLVPLKGESAETMHIAEKLSCARETFWRQPSEENAFQASHLAYQLALRGYRLEGGEGPNLEAGGLGGPGHGFGGGSD